MNRSSEGIAHAGSMANPAGGEIRIWLDGYGDLFSDFDPRPYRHRALSDDFLAQVRKVSRDRGAGPPVLMLLMPAGSRNGETEKEITGRLHSFFVKTNRQLLDVRKRNYRLGILQVLAGFALMVAASFLSYQPAKPWSAHLVLVLFEPAGWFLFWMGLDRLIAANAKSKKDRQFYALLSGARIGFSNY